MIIRYDSIAALRADYIKRNASKREFDNGDSWYNNETQAETLRKTEVGDTGLVAEAEKALDQLDQVIETPRLQWEPNVAGAFCCVPDVLAGRPTNMRRMVHQPDERAPITILVDMGSSASVSAETMRKRGVTVLALVLALSRIRPLSLQIIDCGGGPPNDKEGELVLTATVNTTPLDLATACYTITSVAFPRRICYSLEETYNGRSGAWPIGFNSARPMDYYNPLLSRMGYDPTHCLMIGAAHIRDPLITEPLVWINQQIQRFTTQQEETV